MYRENTHVNISSIYTFKCSECDVLDTNEPERLSEEECVGIKNVEKSVVDSLLDTVKYDDVENAYEVSLPWKLNHTRLPDNYSNATKRLGSTFNRLKRNPEVLKEYHEIISDQLQKNVIEKCDKTNANEHFHYLPHREVIREDKQTTKMRIVYDCSSKLANNVSSLNECLHKGPSLSQKSITPNCIYWRPEAFLQIRVNESDRNCFLWLKDPYAENPETIIYRFSRVLFGMNCSISPRTTFAAVSRDNH